MPNPIRFALIGTGAISAIHAQVIAEIPCAELTAAYSVGGLETFAVKWGCAPAEDAVKEWSLNFSSVTPGSESKGCGCCGNEQPSMANNKTRKTFTRPA